MLLKRFMVIFSSVFVIQIIKTEEISNSTKSATESINNSTTDSSGSSTETNVNSSTLETLLSTTTTLSSSSSTLNTLSEGENSSSWELIYPDQNSSTTGKPLSSTTSTIATNTATLTKYLKVDDVTNCQKYFGECLRQVLANVVPKIKNGNQELHIPSLDPIYFNQTAFQFNSGPFTGHITIRYASIYGLTNMKFKKVDFHSLSNDKFKVRLSTIVPKMEAVGAYKGDLQVNNLRVRPNGDFNVTMVGLHMDILCLGVIYRKDEHKFLKFTKNNVTTTFKDSKVNATGIFPDERLNEIVLNVANQYWPELFNIVLPETRNYWSPILLDAFNGALAMVPFDFLT